MATAVVTFKIMPVDPTVDLHKIEHEAKEIGKHMHADVGKVEIEPVAFGLKALKLYIVMDEKIGTEDLEKKFAAIHGVNSCEVIDFRRAIG